MTINKKNLKKCVDKTDDIKSKQLFIPTKQDNKIIIEIETKILKLSQK